MPIPLWAAMANGGKLYTLDDTSVGADKYDSSGPTYTEFDATLMPCPVTAGEGTYSSLRRFAVDIDTSAALNLRVQGMRDGENSGEAVTRAVAITDIQDVIAPLKVTGSELQVALTLSGWSPTVSPVASLGGAAITIVPRRGSRGGSET